MSEVINNKTVFSLLEVANSIQKTINARYTSSYWVKAEMNKLNHYSHSGHCYPELVEKKDNKVIAEMRAVLWKGNFDKINAQFLKTLNEPLKDGIKILFLTQINFDPKYGISLNILDIDPSYTLGDLEKEKQQNIIRLKNENLFDKNKTLQLPLIPQRIAIISVETSKGYADFLNVIDNNQWNYKFFHMLFPSLLQGDKAPSNIIEQLHKIRKVYHHFDLVAIIRGGGGDIGLASYNNYDLAKAVASFPLPVLTGIGHATNETVIEMVAHSNHITPTKLAESLLQKFHDFSVPVQRAEEQIIYQARMVLNENKFNLKNEMKFFKSLTQNILNQNNSLLNQLPITLSREIKNLIKENKLYLDQNSEHIKKHAQQLLKYQKQRLDSLEKNVEILDPINVLKRGFSITKFNGKSIKNPNDLEIGQNVKTILYEGELISKIEKIKPKN